MKSGLKTMLFQAREGGYGVGAFNILNHLTASAVIRAATECSSPVIIQTSVATVNALGAEPLYKMLEPMIEAAPVPVALHLDHCRDVEMCKLCCNLGWDSVMFDGSHLALEDNIVSTRKVRLYAEPRQVDVEGEVGIIAGTEDDISYYHASLAGFEETMRYVMATSVDAVAPAIGTAHGYYKGVPKINFHLVEQLAACTDCPVVVHGGTGLADETFLRLIRSGAGKINISTALKQVYLQGMQTFFQDNPDCHNPLKLDAFVTGKVMEMVKSFLVLFGSANLLTPVIETSRATI